MTVPLGHERNEQLPHSQCPGIHRDPADARVGSDQFAADDAGHLREGKSHASRLPVSLTTPSGAGAATAVVGSQRIGVSGTSVLAGRASHLAGR